MSPYIRSHNTMPKKGVNGVAHGTAHVMLKIAELQIAVAEMAGAEGHHHSTTSDTPAKTKLSKEQKAANKQKFDEIRAQRKAWQETWLREHNTPEEVEAFNTELVALQEKQKAARKAGEDTVGSGKVAHKAFLRSINALLAKYKVPPVPGTPAAAGPDTTVLPASAMEDEVDHDLWMERPQGYPMRDSLRYL